MSKFIYSFLILFITCSVWAQPEDQQKKLEERKAQIQKEIRETEELLQATKKKEKSVTTLIVIQSNKIKLKEKLINITNISVFEKNKNKTKEVKK